MKWKRKVAWALGYDLVNIRKASSSEALTLQLLDASRSSIVFDVGANEGQFADQVLRDRPLTRMISFEPQSVPHEKMRRTCEKYRNWQAAPQMALGADAGSATINISGRDTCSSFLPLTEFQTQVSDGVECVGSEDVIIQRLDEVVPEYLKADDRAYLKIDTQGFEPDVLRGSTGVLDRVVAIQAEFSFTPLYEGETLAPEMMQMITNLGFSVFGFSHGLRNPRTKELVQTDIFFIRA